MKGIIPIGGRGTRMRPVTFSANKHFVPVGNKPLIFYPIEEVVAAGIKEIAITYNPGQLEYAKEFLGDGSRWGVQFTYVLQPNPVGLANIVEVCEEFVNGDSFMFHLGDNIFTQGIKNLREYFEQHKPNGLLAVVHHPENFRLGVPYYDKKGKLIKFVEKPKNPPHDLGIPGIYLADNHFFECFKGKDRIKQSARGEYEIVEGGFQWMIDQGYDVRTEEVPGKWLDPGKFDDWLETNRYLLDINTPETYHKLTDANSKIEGRVILGKDCKIVNSHIRGPVNIGNNIEIRDSFVGPYTSIDDGCVIKGCHIESSVLMKNVVMENVSKPVDNSILGPGVQVINGNNHGNMELFVGELSKIKL